MIKFINTTVKFTKDSQELVAVDQVTLQINKGEFFGIVGSSGAGKSTLIRTVNLLQPPTSGSILINNQDITSLKGTELRKLRNKIGMIFQHFNLIKNATVFDNIAFALKASHTPKEAIKPRVFELLKQVDLEDKARHYPHALSGGQKQRIAIARALANKPEILLCDEATSALDPDNTAEVIRTLKNIKNYYPITILFITHQMEVAKTLFDRMAIMDQGRIIELSDCYSIFAKPQSNVARKLINKIYASAVPAEILAHESKLYLVLFKEEYAYDPVITQASRRFTHTDLSILAGNIEYIQNKPLGRLLISLRGKDETEKAKLLNYLEQQAYVHEIKREA